MDLETPGCQLPETIENGENFGKKKRLEQYLFYINHDDFFLLIII